MVKSKKHQIWQQDNALKARGYTAKYLESKIKATVILTKEMAEQIDKLKPPSQTYGGWIRELVEMYINNLE